MAVTAKEYAERLKDYPHEILNIERALSLFGYSQWEWRDWIYYFVVRAKNLNPQEPLTLEETKARFKAWYVGEFLASCSIWNHDKKRVIQLLDIEQLPVEKIHTLWGKAESLYHLVYRDSNQENEKYDDEE